MGATTKATHTPGPWTVDETKAIGAYGVWTDYATHPGHDGAGYPSQICSLLPNKDDPPREQRDANARLIAAAPDHATVARLLASGVIRWERWDDQRGEICYDGMRYATRLDEFGVPMLTPHLRSVLEKAESRCGRHAAAPTTKG